MQAGRSRLRRSHVVAFELTRHERHEQWKEPIAHPLPEAAQFLELPHIVAAETDAVAALPERVAELAVRLLPVKQVTAVFPLPRLTTAMVWHERTEADPGARYFASSWPRP